MKKYPRNKIPFPVRPGDTVYRLITPEGDEADAPEVVAEVAHGIGFDKDGQLFVSHDGSLVPFGPEGRYFYTEEDAQAFAEDPTALSDDYGTADYDKLDLPLYPGDELFFPDYDVLFDRWQIIVSTCTEVLFNDDGSVDIFDDRGAEDRLIGEIHRYGPPLFDSVRKARAYVRKEGYGHWKS